MLASAALAPGPQPAHVQPSSQTICCTADGCNGCTCNRKLISRQWLRLQWSYSPAGISCTGTTGSTGSWMHAGWWVDGPMKSDYTTYVVPCSICSDTEHQRQSEPCTNLAAHKRGHQERVPA
eukprot:1149868-Pelagomonas_calceolata.AAC.4